MLTYIILLMLILITYILLYKILKLKNCKKYFCIIVFLLFTIMQGFRAIDIGSDTEKYVKFYNLSKNFSLIEILLCKNWVIEPGYGLLMKLIVTLNIPSQVFLIIVAAVINGGFTYFIYKESKAPLISTIIFLGAEFFILSFTALRQMIAVMLILNSFKYIKQKKLFKFICMVLLASTFHKTALIFLPAYFFKDIKITKKVMLFCLIVFFIVQLIGIPVLTFLIKQFYYDSYLISTGGGFTQTLVILVYLLFGLYFYKHVERENHILYIFIYIAFLIQSLACRINMAGRLMWYYYIFLVIFLPMIIEKISSKKLFNKNYINIIKIGIIGTFIIQYLFFSINMYNVLPYSTFL